MACGRAAARPSQQTQPGALRTTDYGLQTTDYGLQATDYGLWTTEIEVESCQTMALNLHQP
jgi:hypothetical protein